MIYCSVVVQEGEMSVDVSLSFGDFPFNGTSYLIIGSLTFSIDEKVTKNLGAVNRSTCKQIITEFLIKLVVPPQTG